MTTKIKILSAVIAAALMLPMVSCKEELEDELCLEVTGIKVSGISGNSALIDWTAANDALQYVLQFRKVGDATFSEAGRPKTNQFAMTGLLYGTKYELRIQTNCPGANSNFSDVVSFTTMTEREEKILKKWTVQSWKVSGIPLTVNSGDYVEYKEGGVYDQLVAANQLTGTWEFGNIAQDQLKVTLNGTTATWQIDEFSTSAFRLHRTDPLPMDSVVLVP